MRRFGPNAFESATWHWFIATIVAIALTFHSFFIRQAAKNGVSLDFLGHLAALGKAILIGSIATFSLAISVWLIARLVVYVANKATGGRSGNSS
jgi:hypothetical protein